MTTTRPDGARPNPSSHRAERPYRFIQTDRDDAVVRLILNRPDKRNALSMQMSDEFIHALESIRDDGGVRVLVIAGAGGTFCAGDDISEMGQWGNANDVMRRVRGYQHMADVLERLDAVTIARVDGFAVGGGLEITMACDLVVAAASARWGMPEVDVGITPGWGGTTRLARLVGRRLTKEVNLLGALHPAARAAEAGLWNRVVPDADLDAAVDDVVAALLVKNHQAVRQLKFIINAGVEADLATAQAFEELSGGLTAAVNGGWQVPDADGGQGIADFVAKGTRWNERRALARDLWSDGPVTT